MTGLKLDRDRATVSSENQIFEALWKIWASLLPHSIPARDCLLKSLLDPRRSLEAMRFDLLVEDTTVETVNCLKLLVQHFRKEHGSKAFMVGGENIAEDTDTVVDCLKMTPFKVHDGVYETLLEAGVIRTPDQECAVKL